MDPNHFIDGEIFREALIFRAAGVVVGKLLLNDCLEKCIKLAHLYGPWCCEARWRSHGAFCRFGKGFAKGYPDSRATMLIGM